MCVRPQRWSGNIRLALEESLAVLNKHQPLKDDDSEGLPVDSTS
jgi:hypothetical protein